MKNNSFYWALGERTGNRQTYHHQCCQVIVCILVFLQLLHMLLQTIALSPSSTTQGSCQLLLNWLNVYANFQIKIIVKINLLLMN